MIVCSHALYQESGGSARTDYRAIQLVKKKKQRGPSASPGKTRTDQKAFMEIYFWIPSDADYDLFSIQGVQD